jgi:hypothetical protein
MPPRQGAFNDPPRATETAAMGLPAPRELGGNAAPLQCATMWLRVITPIALHEGGLAQGPNGPAAQRRKRQRQQLRQVVPVRRREARDDRNPVRVGKNMMFRPGLTVIGRVRSSFFPRGARGARRCRPRRAPNRVGRDAVIRSVTPDGVVSRRPPAATAPAGANTCCRSRTPSPWATSSRESRSGAQRESQSAPRGPESVCGPHVGGCARAVGATMVRYEPINRHQ